MFAFIFFVVLGLLLRETDREKFYFILYQEILQPSASFCVFQVEEFRELIRNSLNNLLKYLLKYLWGNKKYLWGNFKKWYSGFKHPCTIQLTHLLNMFYVPSLGHSSGYREKVISVFRKLGEEMDKVSIGSSGQPYAGGEAEERFKGGF